MHGACLNNMTKTKPITTLDPEPIATLTCRRSAKIRAKAHCKKYGFKEADFTARAADNQIVLDEQQYGQGN